MRKTLLIGLAALLLAALPAAASTFVAYDQGEMVNNANMIVEGRVMALDTFWSEKGRVVVTEATIAVDEVIAGQTTDRVVTVRTFGGQIDGVGFEAHGFPTFEKNEHVIVFLRTERADDSLRVVGYQQGHYRVVTRLDGVTLAVPQIDSEVSLVSRDGHAVPAQRSVQIDQFKAELRAEAARQAQGR